MIPKRDKLGCVSITGHYGYIGGIFTDINEFMAKNRLFDDYALQIDPKTLEYHIGKIDEMLKAKDTYPLKDLANPSFRLNQLQAKYEMVEEIVSKCVYVS